MRRPRRGAVMIIRAFAAAAGVLFQLLAFACWTDAVLVDRHFGLFPLALVLTGVAALVAYALGRTAAVPS